jgi:hypothetical protein
MMRIAMHVTEDGMLAKMLLFITEHFSLLTK